MTKISRDDVIKLAALSSLQLRDEEIDSLPSELETILGYVEQLDEVNTDDIEPVYQVTGLSNVYRADQVESGDATASSLLQLAPETTDTLIKVPKVI